MFPLAAACPLMRVIDTPTMFLGALWLPYRRDQSQLQAAISSIAGCKAVFAHADVVGPHEPVFAHLWTPIMPMHLCHQLAKDRPAVSAHYWCMSADLPLPAS